MNLSCLEGRIYWILTNRESNPLAFWRTFLIELMTEPPTEIYAGAFRWTDPSSYWEGKNAAQVIPNMQLVGSSSGTYENALVSVWVTEKEVSWRVLVFYICTFLVTWSHSSLEEERDRRVPVQCQDPFCRVLELSECRFPVLLAFKNGHGIQQSLGCCWVGSSRLYYEAAESLSFSSRMLPGPLMMYQFQRSFIKAASKFHSWCSFKKKRLQFSMSKNRWCPNINIFWSFTFCLWMPLYIYLSLWHQLKMKPSLEG